MIYGHNKTIHRTGHVDVEIGPDGHVVAVWFRCAMLPFKARKVDEDRAQSMRKVKQIGLPLINAIDFASEFESDARRWHGRDLTGTFAHWCWDWDDLPIDETCPEWPCSCFTKRWARLKWRLGKLWRKLKSR